MTNLLKLFIYVCTLTYTVKAYNLGRQAAINLTIWNAHISPEILNELKDFENLIPEATIDEIVAKHFLIDGNFRTAFKYLRSEQFTQLQRQLLNLPEILDILEFLHLTTVNATTRQTSATATRAEFENDDNDGKTTNTGSNYVSMANAIEGTRTEEKKTVHKKPHTNVQHNSVDDDIASSFNVKPALVRIVLLEDSVVKTNSYDVVTVYNEDHHLNNHQLLSPKYRHRFSNNYHHHHHQHEQYRSLGTFTAFVEEVLQHLPHAEYQNMIKEKCQKNAKFAEFYEALRSQEFKPLVEQSLQTSNIKKIIQNLISHDVDVVALKPIAFQVISWGPNI